MRVWKLAGPAGNSGPPEVRPDWQSLGADGGAPGTWALRSGLGWGDAGSGALMALRFLSRPQGPWQLLLPPSCLWGQCCLQAPDRILVALCGAWGVGGGVEVGSPVPGCLCMRPCPPCTRTDAAVASSAGDRGQRSKRELLSWGRVAPPASPGSRGILPHFSLPVSKNSRNR